MTALTGGKPAQGQDRLDLLLAPGGRAPAAPLLLPGDSLLLGRDHDCGLVLDDSSISRHHTRLVWQDGCWWVQDLGSANGTLIDGVAVKQALLFDGVRLQIGPYCWTARLRPPKKRLPLLDGLLAWKLTSEDPRAGGVDRLLWSPRSILGRSRTSDVVVPCDQVSALHARFASGRGGFCVSDLGSANGIRVNGKAVRAAKLQDGDMIEIADLPFRVRRSWVPGLPLMGSMGVLIILLLVLVLLPTGERRAIELDRWWTRDMYLEQAQRSLEEAVEAWRRPQPARELARACFDIALRSLSAVDYLPPHTPSSDEIAAALTRAQDEFGGLIAGHDLHAILQELERPPPVHAGLSTDGPLPESAGPDAVKRFDLGEELSLIMAEFGIDTAHQPVPPDLMAAIDRQVDFWSNEMRGFTRRAWSRGQEHLPLIETTLRRHRLPEVFSYLPFIESGFRVDVTSHAGARGLWQFMPATARRYGLRVDEHMDERIDPVKSTEAACQYIEYLLNAFGANAFMSAIAAYNKGEYGILRCLGRGADWRSRWNFWDIATRGDGCLKQETIDYVPKFFAAAIVLRRPDVFVIEGDG